MNRYLVALLFYNTLMYADVSIDTQINSIRNASPIERVQLMNAFKQRVSQMNNADRSTAIQAIQAKIQSQSQIHQENRQAKEHITSMEVLQREDISQYQNMSQQQSKNILAHENISEQTSTIILPNIPREEIQKNQINIQEIKQDIPIQVPIQNIQEIQKEPEVQQNRAPQQIQESFQNNMQEQ